MSAREGAVGGVSAAVCSSSVFEIGETVSRASGQWGQSMGSGL
jgi:hypothetical protein